MSIELTPREQDVLDLTAAGLTATQIAAELGIYVGTVYQYLTAMRLKLDAETIPHAIAIAYRSGLLGGAR